MGGGKEKQCEQDEVFQEQMWLEIYFFRRISIMYFIPLEFWSNRKTTKPTCISQSGSIIAKMEVERG